MVPPKGAGGGRGGGGGGHHWVSNLFINVMKGAPVLNCVYLLVKTIQKQQACSLGLKVAPGVGPLIRTIHYFNCYIGHFSWSNVDT